MNAGRFTVLARLRRLPLVRILIVLGVLGLAISGILARIQARTVLGEKVRERGNFAVSTVVLKSTGAV